LLLTFAALRGVARRWAIAPQVERFGRMLPIWAMGSLACAWTFERVLGFWP
jgi:hypothetical protein